MNERILSTLPERLLSEDLDREDDLFAKIHELDQQSTSETFQGILKESLGRTVLREFQNDINEPFLSTVLRHPMLSYKYFLIDYAIKALNEAKPEESLGDLSLLHMMKGCMELFFDDNRYRMKPKHGEDYYNIVILDDYEESDVNQGDYNMMKYEADISYLSWVCRRFDEEIKDENSYRRCLEAIALVWEVVTYTMEQLIFNIEIEKTIKLDSGRVMLDSLWEDDLFKDRMKERGINQWTQLEDCFNLLLAEWDYDEDEYAIDTVSFMSFRWRLNELKALQSIFNQVEHAVYDKITKTAWTRYENYKKRKEGEPHV